MGVISDKIVADYYGTRIEVEGGISGLTTSQFRLVIDGQKMDEISFGPFGGDQSLRAVGHANGAERRVEVRVTQGMMGTNFTLLIDGREHPHQRIQ